jgi:hypothetical protein
MDETNAVCLFEGGGDLHQNVNRARRVEGPRALDELFEIDAVEGLHGVANAADLPRSDEFGEGMGGDAFSKAEKCRGFPM